MTQAATTTPAPDGQMPAEVQDLLKHVLDNTPQDVQEPVSRAVEDLVREVMAGQVTFDKNVMKTIDNYVAEIDRKMSKQLAAIMHHPEFQKLEGSWRGLHYLVMNSETSTSLKIKVLNVSKRDLQKDLANAVEFDQSQLFKKVYEDEYGMPGGAPYGALIGDYQFTKHPDDISMLEKIAEVAAAAHAPFITQPGPELFGFKSFTELAKPRDLAKIFDTVEYAQWNSFRESENSRYVVMTMPRVLARLPFGSLTKTIDEFAYEEVEPGKPVPHDQYSWMNAAFVYGTKLTDAFAKWGWCTAIRGAENGGRVDGLPAHTFRSDDGDVDLKCPTEVGITGRRENELSKLGMLALNHYKNTDYAVFYGAQTVQKPKKYEGKKGKEATANADLSAKLPYIMACSRFTHYLKVIARDKIGSFMERSDCEKWLNDWIANYISADPSPSEDVKRQYPLAEARITVEAVPGAPGQYSAIAHLRPWIQFEALTASMRMVAQIPQLAG